MVFLFISGRHIKCDDSGSTGESDGIKKTPYDEVLKIYRDAELQGRDASLIHTDCFMSSGSKILEGVGKYAAVEALRTNRDDVMMGKFTSSGSKLIILD